MEFGGSCLQTVIHQSTPRAHPEPLTPAAEGDTGAGSPRGVALPLLPPSPRPPRALAAPAPSLSAGAVGPEGPRAVPWATVSPACLLSEAAADAKGGWGLRPRIQSEPSDQLSLVSENAESTLCSFQTD